MATKFLCKPNVSGNGKMLRRSQGPYFVLKSLLSSEVQLNSSTQNQVESGQTIMHKVHGETG
eukprot:1407333-Amphidinium_carterae.1